MLPKSGDLGQVLTDGGEDWIYLGPQGWQALRGRPIGHSLQTASGRLMWPLQPYTDEIFPEDIARGLSSEGRYANQSPAPYTVGWHTIALSYLVPEHLQQFALIHDAPEAYIKDMPRTIRKQEPFKTEYDKIDNRLLNVICERFDIENQMEEFYPYDIRMSHSEMIVWAEHNPVYMAKLNAMGVVEPEAYDEEWLQWVRDHPVYDFWEKISSMWLARYDRLFE